MFCTGGIRCEKATSYALQSGLFPQNFPVYHLEGGILAYLDYVAKKKETNDEAESAFRGECFVFDQRVALVEGLKPTKNYVSCHGCRGPVPRRLSFPFQDGDDAPRVSEEFDPLMEGMSDLPQLCYDPRTRRRYLPGLTCPRCHASTTRESLERFVQRKRQIELAEMEGKSHFRDGKEVATRDEEH